MEGIELPPVRERDQERSDNPARVTKRTKEAHEVVMQEAFGQLQDAE